MPTYSYACTSCGHNFDIRQSFTDDALTVCPECTEKALRKVIHPVGISFKGSGFYKTDSRVSAGKGSPASAPTASGSDGSGSDGSGSNGSTSSDSGATSSSGTSGESSGAAASAPAASTASSTAS